MRIIFTLIFVMSASICIEAQEEEQIMAILNTQVNHWNDGSVEGFMEAYWKSDSLQFIGKSGLIMGWQGLYKRYITSYKEKNRMGNLAFSDLSVQILSSTSSFVSGQWKLKNDSTESVGRFSLLMQVKNGSWKIVYDHSSGIE